MEAVAARGPNIQPLHGLGFRVYGRISLMRAMVIITSTMAVTSMTNVTVLILAGVPSSSWAAAITM